LSHILYGIRLNVTYPKSTRKKRVPVTAGKTSQFVYIPKKAK
jgi:hypothetical protein